MSSPTLNNPSTATSARAVRRGSWLMAFSVAAFTANALLLKYLADHWHLNGWVSLAFRFVVGLVVTWLIFAPKKELNLARCFSGWLLISRGVLGGISTAAFYLSIGPLGAGKCVLIGNTWTIFAALMAVGVLGEKLTAAKLTGIAVALVGLGLLMGVGPGKFGDEWRWELIQLGGAVMAAMVVVVIRQLTKTETSATIFMSQCIYGVLLAVPFALLHQTALNGTVISLLLLAGLLAAAGQLAMTEGFRHLTVAAGGAFQITLPLAISVGGVLMFDEHFGPWQILGGVLILAGCFQTIARGQDGR